MLDVLRFYIDVVRTLMHDVWGSFMVAPGVSFLNFMVACSIMILFLSLLKLKFESDIVSSSKFDYSELQKESRFSYKPKHVYQPKHAKKRWF